MATVHGAAAPLGVDFGLPEGEEFDLAEYLDFEAMTAEQVSSWPAQDTHSSNFNSPLDTYSTAASDWTREAVIADQSYSWPRTDAPAAGWPPPMGALNPHSLDGVSPLALERPWSTITSVEDWGPNEEASFPTPFQLSTVPVLPAKFVRPSSRRTTPRVPCQVLGCGKTFANKSGVARHNSTQHGGANMHHHCLADACDYKTIRADKVREHCRRKHGQAHGEEQVAVVVGSAYGSACSHPKYQEGHESEAPPSQTANVPTELDESNVATNQTKSPQRQASASDEEHLSHYQRSRHEDVLPVSLPDHADGASSDANESETNTENDGNRIGNLHTRATTSEWTSTDEGYASMKSQGRATGRTDETFAPSVADPGFDHPTTTALVSMFVHDVVQNLPQELGLGVFSNAMSMSLLIRHYAMMLGKRATSSVKDTATRFVRFHRRAIAEHLSQAAGVTLDRASDALTSQQRLDLLWGTERTHRSDDVEHLTADENDEDDDNDDVSTPHIPDVDVDSARKFLVDSNEFSWLLSRTALEAGLTSTGSTYGDTRTQLIDLVGTRENFQFVMDWDPWEFCQDQYSNGDVLDMGKVICLSGGAERAYASSCGAYLKRIWPATAATVLQIVNIATKGGYGQYQAYSPSDLQVDDHFVNLETCWHRMFRNPAIAQGYPIPTRAHGQQGLEIPLDMMASLGETPNVALYDDITMLKGFSSLFTPTKRVEDSVIWHFLVNRDGSRISYNDGVETSSAASRAIHPMALATARHFVGWTPNAEQMAGSDHITYTTGWSGAKFAKPPFVSMSSMGVSVGKIVGANATFIRGKKDTPSVNNSDRIYMDKVKAAGDWTVVFYDRMSRRAWLSDGTSALLHISRAWLASHRQGLDDYAEANADSDLETEITAVSREIASFKWPGKPVKFEGQRSARLALYNEKNRQLRVWKNRDSKTETTTEVRTGSITVSEKATDTWTRWQDIVDEKFSMLELVHDRINKSRNCPTVDLTIPFRERTFEGYEFKDMVTGTSLLQPRMVKLHATAGDWPKWSLQSDTIPIFGSDFGEMIRPAKTCQGLQCCGQTSLLPGGLDYLAAPVNVLASLRSKTSAAGHSGIALGDSVTWREPWACFVECHCKMRRHCLVKIARLDFGRFHVRRSQMGLQPEEAVLKQYSQGAIIFGDEHAQAQDVSGGLEYVEPNRLKRCTQQISDSGIDAPSPSLDVPPSQDSGVYLSSPSSQDDDRIGSKRQRLENFEAVCSSEKRMPLRDQHELVCEISQVRSLEMGTV
ncbi:hypothetical protein LTS10_010754 [Elasticomyces elasticus]|nr:hypothetical protein LTS10_010754 [Elasticomyces elasticus]